MATYPSPIAHAVMEIHIQRGQAGQRLSERWPAVLHLSQLRTLFITRRRRALNSSRTRAQRRALEH